VETNLRALRMKSIISELRDDECFLNQFAMAALGNGYRQRILFRMTVLVIK
jgi:hypothetical protein